MAESHKILGIIPARGGSKRVPGKNKKKLAGKELIRYVIEASLHSELLSEIIVTSDDEDILDIATRYEQVRAIRRPENISGDKAPAVTYVHHALSLLSDKYDYTVIIQPSSPFTTGEDIDNTIRLLLESDGDSSASVMQLDHAIHPVKLKTMEGDLLLPYLEEENGRMAAHELPELFVRNCSVYVSSMKIIEEGRIIGDKCMGYVMPRERSIDINDPIDFEFAEYLAKKLND